MLENDHRSIKMETFSQHDLCDVTRNCWVSHAAAVFGTTNTDFCECYKIWSWSIEQEYFSPLHPYNRGEPLWFTEFFNKETINQFWFNFKKSVLVVKRQIYHLLLCIFGWYVKLIISSICKTGLMIPTSQDSWKINKITWEIALWITIINM